jgi:hypothetical protein
MTRGIGRRAPLFTFCFSVFLSGAASAAPPSPAATPTAPPPSATAAAPLPSATITATVQSIDAQARTLEVVTGVGYALRVVKISWKEAPTVKAAAAGAGMAQLKPGDLVRVEYTKSPEGNVVRTIELLPSPAPPSVR